MLKNYHAHSCTQYPLHVLRTFTAFISFTAVNSWCYNGYSHLWVVSYWLVGNRSQELVSGAAERKKIEEAEEIKPLFCWKIRAPRIWSCQLQGVCKYSSSIIGPVYAEKRIPGIRIMENILYINYDVRDGEKILSLLRYLVSWLTSLGGLITQSSCSDDKTFNFNALSACA
jgi:hypothetical protein